MDPDEKQNEVVQRNVATGLLPHDVKEIEAFSQFAEKHENKMKKMTGDVNNMGSLKLIWDSKVPAVNKRFYYFFSFKKSNRVEIKEEIQKYIEFYRQMGAMVPKMSSGEGTENEEENVYLTILDLYKKLTDLAKVAETGKETTGSSTVCELHSQFIAKHEKLGNMIKRMECISLKQSLKKATDGLQQSLKAIDGLRDDLKASESKYDKMCDKFDELLFQNKKLIVQQNFLLEENGKIMQQQQILLEDNKNMKQQTDLLVGILTSFAKQEKSSEIN